MHSGSIALRHFFPFFFAAIAFLFFSKTKKKKRATIGRTESHFQEKGRGIEDNIYRRDIVLSLSCHAKSMFFWMENCSNVHVKRTRKQLSEPSIAAVPLPIALPLYLFSVNTGRLLCVCAECRHPEITWQHISRKNIAARNTPSRLFIKAGMITASLLT